MESLSRPVAFRAIAAATAVLLALGLIGAVTVNEETDTLDATGSTATTLGGPEATLAPVPGGSVPPGGPAPSGPAATPAPTQPAPATTAPQPASERPGEVTMTRPGLYRYKTTTDGKESRTELRVSDDGGSGGEQRQVHRKSSGGDTTESSVAWRSNGIFERSRTFPSGDGETGAVCDWEPDVMLAARPLRADSTWNWDSRCRSRIQGQEADFHFTGQSRVTEAVRANVGGRQVSAWRIQSTAKIEITGTSGGQPFTVVVDITSDDQFAPQQGILVRSDYTSKVTAPGSPPQEERVLDELQNLDPA